MKIKTSILSEFVKNKTAEANSSISSYNLVDIALWTGFTIKTPSEIKVNPLRKIFSSVKVVAVLLLSLILLTNGFDCWAQSQTFTTSGTFTVPAGVTSVTVQAWGGGGAGGSRTNNGGGGGGGGGAYSSGTVTVVPNTTYTVNVGTAGNDSWFGSTTTLLAKGGTSVASNTATGGTGGLASAGIGTITYNGATGITGTTTYGGGGGSSAGTGANGNAGTTSTGGIAPTGGGNGGNGAAAGQGNGSAGSAPGGGGGGSLRTSSGTRNGGAGAAGQVIVSWTPPTYTSTGTGGNWSSAATWSPSGPPTVGSNVIIAAGAPVTLDLSTPSLYNLTINDQLDASNSLYSVTGTGTFAISSSGTLLTGGTFPSGFGTYTLDPSSTVNYNGTAQTVSALAYGNLILSGSGAKTLTSGITIAGNLTLRGAATTSTVANLTISGNLSVGDGTTFTAGAYTLLVTGTTTIGNGTSGILTINSTTGTKTFAGAVTINSNAVFSETVAEALSFGSDVINYGTLTENGNAAISTAGNFTNNGTYTASTGIHTFSGSAKTFSGTTATSIGSVTVTGTYANNGILTVGTALSGTGTLTNSSAGTLNIGGTSSITTLSNAGTVTVTGSGAISTALANFTNTGTLNLSGSGTITGITNSTAGIINLANSGTITSLTNATSTSTLNISDNTIPTITTLTATVAGNTVNYSGTGQTLKVTSYSNLTLSGGAAETFGAITTVGGNLILSGSATATTGANLTIGGNLQVGDGTTLTVGGFTLSVTGTTTIGGGISGSLIFSSVTNPNKTFTGLVTINNGASWTESAAITPTFSGGITNNGTFTASTGIHTFSTNNQALTGTLSIPSLTIGGTITLTNNNILTIGSALAGPTGFLINAAGATLNLSGPSVIGGLTATAMNNTVNFTGAAQNINPTNFYNLILSGSGAKTFQAGTSSIGGNLAINSGVSALLVAGSNITANTLSLNGISQLAGTWGNTASAATYKNNTYFGTSTGIVTVSSSTCTPGTWLGSTSTDWNVATNWCGGVPTSTTNVIINASGNQPVIGSAGGLCNNIIINSGATLTMSGAYNLTVSGNWTNGGTYTPGTGTVLFNGISQTIGGTATTTFNNLSTSGSATVTTGAALTIGGNLSIGDGTTFMASAYALTVTGATTVGSGTSGTLTILSATGTKAFNGNVTVNTGGTWNNTAANVPLTLPGSISNSGTFNAGTGVYTLSGATKTISGTLSIPSVAVTGTYTNNGSLTVNTALSGAGGLTQGASTSAILNLGGTSSITTLAATNPGNTVNFTGISQTINPLNYYNLTLSGSGTDVLQTATTTISGNLTVSGTVTTTQVANLTITGNLWVTTGATFSTAGALTLTAGTIQVDGTFNEVSTGALTVATLIVNGTWNYSSTSSILPLGSSSTTWAANSNLNITTSFTTATVFTNFIGQTFGNFTYNCPGQTNTVAFVSAAGTTTIQGNFTVISTGTSAMYLRIGNQPYPATVNINGNFILSGGTFDMHDGGTYPTTEMINLVGNFTMSGGTLSQTTTQSGSTVLFNFVGSGIQTVNITGGTITSQATTPTCAIQFIVANGSTINMGTSVLTGTNNTSFTLSAGAGIITANTGGLSANGATGSIQVSGPRSYSPIAEYTYNSLVAGQVTGSGVTAADDMTFENTTSSGVTFSNSIAISGTMAITNGAHVNLGTYVSSTNILTLNGTPQALGTSYGGNTSAAAVINATYFNTATGILNVSLAPPSSLSYNSPFSFPVSVPITEQDPTVTGIVTSFSISPSLPAGLSFNTSTGAITGTPTASTGSATYTVTASNSAGSTSFGVVISIGNYRYAVNAASADWNLTSTWSATSGGSSGASIPVSGDQVFIGEASTNRTVTIPSGYSAACGSLTMGNVSAATTATLSMAASTSSLTVDDNLVMNRPVSAATTSISVGAGTMTVGGTLQLANSPGSYVTTTLVNSVSISTGTVTVGNLYFGGQWQTQSQVVFSGTGTLNISGSFTTQALLGTLTPSTGTVNFNGSGAQTIPFLSAITYNNLTLSGGNTKTLSANTTVPGILTVNAGTTLNLSTYSLGTPSNIVLGCGAIAGSVISGVGSLTSGGTVTVNDAATGTNGALISCPVTLSAAPTFTVADDGTSATDLTVSGIISGGYGVVKAGPGTLVLSGANSYSGATSINAGTLKLGTSSTVSTSGPLGTTAGTTTVSSGAVLDLNGFSLTSGATNPIILNGSGLTGAAAGALTNTGATPSTIIGAITLGSVATITAAGTTGTLTCSGAVTGAFGLTLDGAFGSSGTMSGIISTPTSVTKNGAGTWTNSGANTYTGNTSVTSGTLKLGASTSALGTGAGITSVTSGAVLDLNGFTLSTAEPLTLNGTGLAILPAGALTNTGGNASFSGPITLGASGATITATTSGTLTCSGAVGGATYPLTLDGAGTGTMSGIIGTTSGIVTKNGAGTWILSGANTYSGATNINTGTLMLGNGSALGTPAGNTTVLSGAVLDLNGTTLSSAEPVTINGTGISGNGALINSSATAANYSGAITMGSASTIGTTGNITLGSAGIAGGQNLTKIGTATLNLGSGTSTLGALNIIAGTLISTSGILNLTGNLTNNGTFTHNGGIVSFNGTNSQTIGGNSTAFNNLIINNTSSSGNNTVNLNTPVSTSSTGILTMTSGLLTTTTTNLLSVLNTATSAISGGSTSCYINGPVLWTLPSSLGSGSTYNFPVGASSTYLPFSLVNPTTSTGLVTAQVQAFTGSTGGTFDATLISLSTTEYWSLATAGNFTNSSVSLSRQTAITPLDVIGGSSSLAGVYTSLAGTAGTNGVTNSNAIGTDSYFVLAGKQQSIATGTITGFPFCAGASVSVPFTISGTFTSGNIFTAQLSDGSGSFSSPVSIGSLTQTTSGTISGTIPGGALSGTQYRIRVVSSTPVITGTDNGVNLTINAQTAISSQSTATQTQCASGTFAPITVTATGSGTLNYQWYSNTLASNSSGTLLSGATSSSYTPSASTVGTLYYYCVVTGSCGTVTSIVSGAFIVNPTTAISSQSTGTQTQCAGGTFSPISVTATGTGTLTYQWYSNTSSSNTGGTSLGTANGAQTNSYTPQATSAGTLYYYCVVTGTCATATSSISGAFIVNPSSVGGTISGGGTEFCQGGSTGTMTLSGYAGIIQNWQRQVNSLGWSSVGNYGVATYSETPYSGGIWQYRAMVQNGSCPVAYSSVVTIIVDSTTTVGTLGGGTTPICQGASLGTLTLSAGTGRVVQWEKQLNGGGWTIISNTSRTYSEIPSSGGTWNYRVLVQSGTCSSLYSNIFTVVVNPTLTITLGPNPVICVNTTVAQLSYTATTGSPTAYSITFDATAVSAGMASFSGYGLPSSPISINVPYGIAPGVYNGILSVGTSYPVCSSIGYPITVTVQDNTIPATITGASTPCQGSSQTYNAAAISGATYAWTFPTGWVQTGGGTTSSVTVTVGAASGNVQVTPSFTCGSGTTQTLAVTPVDLPSATISYAGTPYCKSVLTAQNVTLSGTSGGTYTASPSGLTINSSTGAITPNTSTAGTYTVTYSMTASGGCGVLTATTSVTITAIPTAIISYAGSPFCSSLGSDQSVTLSGTGAYSGGTYSSTAGLTINASTGAITPGSSTAGTYTVTYTIPASGGCASVPATTSVTITTLPVATFSYTGSPYCSNGTNPSPTFSGGGVAGTFSSTTGLVFISAATGQINLASSTPGTYTVTNTIAAAGGCAVVTATSPITITALPTAAISYSGTPFCNSVSTPQSVTFAGTSGGTYTASPSGLTINATTGAITPNTSTAGTYTVTYTIAAASGCGTVTATTSVILTAVPTAIISYAGSPFCSSLGSAQSVTLSGTGAYSGGTYSSTAGLTINASTGAITPGSSTAGTYTVTYTIPASGGCASVPATTSVTITTLPVATFSYTGSPYCSNGTNPSPTFSGGGVAGTFSSTTGLVFISAATGQINLASSTPGTYTVTNTIAAAGDCAVVTATSPITITALPTAAISYSGTPFCQSVSSAQPVILTGTGAYTTGTYSSTAGLTINATTGAITPNTSNTGTYTVTYTIAAAGGCGTVTATTSVILTAVPTATISYAGSPFCSSLGSAQPVTLSGTGAYSGGTYSSTAGLTINASTGAITPGSSTAGTYTVTYTIPASGGCASVPATTSVTITTLPVATFSYTGSPYCSNGTNPSPTFSGGGVAGTFSSTTGLVFISAATGQINLASSTPGTYTVTNTIAAAGGCAVVTATSPITITALPVATFSYTSSPYCSNGTNPSPTFSGGGLAGTFSSTTGLVFVSAATGQINLASSTPGSYTVTNTIAAAGGCAVVIATSPITIYPQTIINTLSATPQTQCIGGTFTPISVTTSGVGLSYQWYSNTTTSTSGGNSLGSTNGAQTNNYTPSAAVAGTLYYYCVVTGTCGTATSAISGAFIVNPATAITSQSTATQTQCITGTFTAISVTASGTGTLTYQWYSNASSTNSGGTPISGATGSSYIPSAAAVGTLYYYCIVTGTCATATSAVSGAFVVNPATAISSQSTAAQSTCLNTAFSPISVTATGTGTLTYQWYSNTTSSNSGGTSISGANGSSYTPSDAVAGTLYYYCIVHGGCGTDVTSAISGAFIVISDLTWTGTVSTDWNTIANWSCPFLPGLTTNVTIPNVTNQPILSAGANGLANNIVINSGSSLTVTGNTMQIAGAITNSGNFTATAGTIQMAGSTAQTIGASTFAGNTIMNLTISNSAGVTLAGPLSATGIVIAESGDLNSAGNLVLISSATQTALIDGSGAKNVNGNVTMQRYLPSAYGYKYVSSPFQSATVGELSGPVNLSATFPAFYSYNENNSRDSLGVTAYQSGWVNYTNGSNLLTPLSGYAANFGTSGTPETFSLTGVVNNGPLSVNLMNNNRIYTQGFNLVGNPYPSPIDWNASSGWTKTNIDNAIYFFNAGNTDQYSGSYSSYVNGVASGDGNNLIASMQGFFIHVSNGSYPVTGTLGMTNSVRTNDLAPTFRDATLGSRTILRFTANLETNNPVEDVALLYFENKAGRSFNKELDALKLYNTDVLVPNLYTLSSEQKQLSIYAIPQPTDTTTRIPLGVMTLSDGYVDFNAKEISGLPSTLYIYLVDSQQGLTQDLKKTPGYRFYLKAGTYNQRFSLVFSITELNPTPTVAEKMFTVTRSASLYTVTMNLPLNTNGTLYVTNVSGQIILLKEVADQQTVEINPTSTSGLYIITVIAGNNKQSEKILIR